MLEFLQPLQEMGGEVCAGQGVVRKGGKRNEEGWGLVLGGSR